ncbi:hypothetical protein LBMAG09_12420 [Actinomycetes bacterium]|nr:hypothetical protein LBMAG09_12420 [Actinomycetes bacterium]
MANKPHKNLQIILAFAMGIVRGGVIGLSAPILGLVDSVPIPLRMANSAVAVFYWLQIGAIYFEVRDSFRKSLRGILREAIFEPKNVNNHESNEDYFENSREKIRSLINNLKLEIAKKSDENILPNFKKQIDAIDELIENHIKPQSTKKWQDSELIWPKFSFKNTLIKSISSTRIPLLGVIILTFPFSIIGNMVGYGIIPGFFSEVVSTICPIVTYFLIYKVIGRNFSRLSENIIFLFLCFFTSLSTNYLYLKKFTIESENTARQTLQVELTAISLFIVFLFVATMLLTYKESQEKSLEIFKNTIPKGDLDLFISSGLEAKSQADLAQYLHAEVQSQLHACKLLLLKAAESDFTLFSPQVTQMVMVRLESLNLPYTKSLPRIPKLRLTEIASSWNGIAMVTLELPKELEVFTPNGEVISQLIEESIVNSIRHGKAKFINVAVKVENGFCEVLVTNDGPLKTGGPKGLGSTLFDTFADSWTIEENLDGTKIWFKIPFEQSTIG